MASASSSSSSFGKDGAERRELGANGVDVIDEFCEASVFSDAAKYLTKAKLKLSNDQKLEFYALFKQATVGPCNTSKPSLLAMRDRAKWSAWNDLKQMSKDEAIVRYVAALEHVAPSWASLSKEEGGEGSSDDEGGSSNEGAMITPQSRPVAEAEVPEAELSENDKTVWFWAGLGNVAQVKAFVKKGGSVDAKDDEGRTPLHWAVDRAHIDLAKALLQELGAQVNAVDADGSTALHYAALCEHLPLVSLLLQHGADAQLADEAGDTPADAIRSLKGVTPEILALVAANKTKSS